MRVFINTLTLLRAPLALLFLVSNPILRISAVALAMVTDSIDGYLARRQKKQTSYGAVLDASMDKLFAYFAFTVLFLEGRLLIWQICAMLTRDVSLCLFGIYLRLSKRWEGYEFRSIRWGKATTALQFIVLMGLIMGVSFPTSIYALFVLFGVLAFRELFQLKKQDKRVKEVL